MAPDALKKKKITVLLSLITAPRCQSSSLQKPGCWLSLSFGDKPLRDSAQLLFRLEGQRARQKAYTHRRSRHAAGGGGVADSRVQGLIVLVLPGPLRTIAPYRDFLPSLSFPVLSAHDPLESDRAPGCAVCNV